MAGGWTADQTSEVWWDSLSAEGLQLDESPERTTLSGLDWADHQTDCFSLSPLFYPEDEAPCGSRSLTDLVSGGLEDEFELAATLARTPLKSPSSLAFKDSFENKSPVGCALTSRDCPQTLSPTTPGHSVGESSQSAVPEHVTVGLQLAAAEGSNSVTCTITGGWDEARNNQASSGKNSSTAMEADDVSPVLFPSDRSNDSKSASSEHQGDSRSLGLPMEVDLQCKGEQLGEEDSGTDAARMHWMGPTGHACMDFIPVSTPVLLETSSYSTDSPSAAHSGKEGSSETEGTSQQEKTVHLGKSCGTSQDETDESPAVSERDSVLSEATTLLSGLEGKRRVSKPGKLAEAASVSDMTATDAKINRRRPGRPSKGLGAGGEARAASTKRKRAATSKPAAPTRENQTCTQCFTHSTPVWRAGPEGPKTLCNACGVRYMKVAKKK